MHRGNVVLIGDASGTVDAITGEGLGLAFSQAVALASCLESGDLRRYQIEHRKLAVRPLCMGRLMLMLDRRPWLSIGRCKFFGSGRKSFAGSSNYTSEPCHLCGQCATA